MELSLGFTDSDGAVFLKRKVIKDLKEVSKMDGLVYLLAELRAPFQIYLPSNFR